MFGDLQALSGSEHAPAVWLQQAAQHPEKPPFLYIAVTRQEDLYPLSVSFHAACQSLGISSEYHEEDGGHNWFARDRQIRHFLETILGPRPED